MTQAFFDTPQRFAKLLVVGDIMLDRFVYGRVERISPEGPIPVLHMQHTFDVLGGVGNLVRNLNALQAEISLVTVMGQDETSNRMMELLQEIPLKTSLILKDKSRKTTTKTRFIAQSQQILRLDEETLHPLPSHLEKQAFSYIETHINDLDGILLSDYGKGMLTKTLCQNIIDLAKKAGVWVFIDPKGRDFEKYKGATLIKPNEKEFLEQLKSPPTDEADFIKKASQLKESLGVDSLLITRGSKGMLLLKSQQDSISYDSQAKEVFDVSGAGDTVLATLATAYGEGLTLQEATNLANLAGGLVVGKTGTAVIQRRELGELFSISHPNNSYQIQDVLPQIQTWRRKGQTIGFTNGCFDLLHAGHLFSLRQAKAKCDRLVLGLNTDSSIKRLKGNDRPIQPEHVRAEVLASLEIVDAVVLFDDDTPLNLIQKILPDRLFKGSDYTVETVVGADIVIANGGEVVLLDLKPGFSTTATVSKMKAIC